MGCSNGIYKKKSKEIRVCVDFSTGLNAALKDYHYSLPSPEEVFNKLNKNKEKGIHRPVDVRPIKKKNIHSTFTNKRVVGGVLWEPYPSLHNGLFLPLLVLRDFATTARSISVLSEQYETSYLFYVTIFLV